jgi:hypothetical protein
MGKKRKPFSEEHRNHLSQAGKGNVHSEEHIRHIKEAWERKREAANA